MSRIWRKGNRTIIGALSFLLVVGLILAQAYFAQATNKVTNGSFVSNITGWINNTAPSAIWNSIGLSGTIINAGSAQTASGGSLQMSVTGTRVTGTGYMSQTITTTETNPTVKLSFAWKKNYALTYAPTVHEARVRIFRQSDSTTYDAWVDTTVSNSNTWNRVEDVDLTTFMANPGTYEIQLYANLKSGNNSLATAEVGFDEVYLNVASAADTTPPTFSLSYYSDSNLTIPLPLDGSSNPVTKVGSVFVKVTANEPLQAVPTISISAPGLGNDRTTVATTLVSGNDYKYQWDVIKDTDGNAVVSVTGKDVAGNTGTSISSGTTVALDTTVLAPGLDSATASIGKVDLTWSTSQTDIDHYEVHRSTTNGFTPSGATLINGTVTGTSYSDTSVSQAITYYYKIIAVDKVGNISSGSNQLSVTTIADTTPPNFSVGYFSDAGMTVPLQVVNGKPITKAQAVYIKATASEALIGAPTITIAAPGTANDKTNLTMSVVTAPMVYSYTWTVASGATNDGDATLTISGSDGANTGTSNNTVTVNTQISTPATPIATSGPGNVSLTWSTTDTDITNFKIYRSLTSGFVPSDATDLIATVGNVASYTDTTCTYPNTYYYKVKSVDTASNISTASNQAIGTPTKVNPHGGYGTNTAMCAQCHNSHDSQGSNLLANADTTSTCYLCHDAGGQSSYNVATEFNGISHHKVPEGTQICTDCHNPHNDATTNIRLLQTNTGKTGGNDFCWTCHGTGSVLPAPNGDHQANYPALGSGHNNNTWTASNGKTPFDPDYDIATAGKPGIGCEGCHQEHGSSIGKLLRVVDWNNDTLTPQSGTVDYGASQNNKDFCFECHGNAGRADAVAEADNAWLGKTAYASAITEHSGTGSSCTLKCHQPHGSSFASRYLSPNESGFDYLKNTYDQNFNATRSTAYAATDFQTCNQCHDLNALVNNDTTSSGFTDKGTRNKNLHRVHLIDAGTSGKGNAVCKECHDPHGTNTNWNSSGEHIVAFAATSVLKNTLTYPKFTDNAVGEGGKGTCDLVCHGVAHKDAGVLPTVNSTYSGAAVSSGEGGACFTCHGTGASQFGENMLRNAVGFYTHPIANDAEDINASTPNCTTLCHATHTTFADVANIGGRAANLKTIGGPSATENTTNKDFDATDTTNGGLCLSCHKNSQNDTLHTQPDGRTGTAPWDTDPATAISLYKLSGHNYSVTTTFTKDSSTFNANCTKCHNDTLTKVYQVNADNTKKIGLHNTPVPWSISKFNLASNPDNEEQDFCYKCHGTAAGGSDYYGTPSAGNIESIVTSSTTSTHPVQSYTGKHIRYNKVLGIGEIATNWLPSTNRHVECGDCHDPHTASEGNSLTSGTGTVVKKPDAEVRNVEGVTIDEATWSITGTTLSSQRDYQVCLKCHSKWAWGTSIPNIPSTYNGTTRSQEHQSYSGEPLTILDEFKPANQAYHPLFRVGKNQPTLNANSNWTGTNRRLKSTEAGKKYWGGDGVTSVNGRLAGPTWYEPEGLDNTFVDGWGTMSLVSCSDCHGSNNTTVEGPHGSSYKWLLKGSEPNVGVTTPGGIVYPNTAAFWGASGNDLTALQSNFCINCHRADVYGPGYAKSGTVPNLSRFTHQRNAGDAGSNFTSGKGNTLTPYGCTNCHGGYETGGIHGTAMPAQSGFTDASGKRFMNGASWAGHNLGTTSVTCTTAPSNSINTCTQHGNPSNAGTLNYSY
jgi:predicted CXXCH cytochrome family protein